jgi:hypothetical protein
VNEDERSAGVPDGRAEPSPAAGDLKPNAVGEYHIPDTNRRRRVGLVYLVGAVVVAALIVIGPLPNAMWWTAVVVLGVVGVYHLASGWNLAVREEAALETANREIGFPVGHASATLGFVGWRARPVWNVLVFSAEDPPVQQGLVRVDGVDGYVVDSYAEPVDQ